MVTCITVEPDPVRESKFFSLILEIFINGCRNINIPWATKGMGDGDYMFAFQQIVMPIAREFDPDFVVGKFYPPVQLPGTNLAQLPRDSMQRQVTNSGDVLLRLLATGT